MTEDIVTPALCEPTDHRKWSAWSGRSLTDCWNSSTSSYRYPGTSRRGRARLPWRICPQSDCFVVSSVSFQKWTALAVAAAEGRPVPAGTEAPAVGEPLDPAVVVGPVAVLAAALVQGDIAHRPAPRRPAVAGAAELAAGLAAAPAAAGEEAAVWQASSFSSSCPCRASLVRSVPICRIFAAGRRLSVAKGSC